MALPVSAAAEDVAAAIMEYERAGVSQFILSGWPKAEEMIFFGERVLPLVRALERETAQRATA